MGSVQTVAAPDKSQGVMTTSIGMKLLMAITGSVFILFVIGHLLGNLQIFIGQEQVNKYAEALKGLGAALWVIRAFLATFFLIHIWMGIKLWFGNNSARPISYAKSDTVQASISSRTMIYSGVGILLYVIYHVMHFTMIVTNPEYATLTDGAGRFDVYSMVVLGFQDYAISGVYIVAMVALGFHVNHAVGSVFQTLGLNCPAWRRRTELIGTIVAFGVFLGYTAIPVAVLLNIIKLPGGGY